MKKFLSVFILAMFCTGVPAFAQTNTNNVTVSNIKVPVVVSSKVVTIMPEKPIITLAISQTLKNLMTSIKGEVTANAKYLAFADIADKEGYKGIAGVLRAISDAELKHAQDEFAIAQTLCPNIIMPESDTFTVGTTKENLQAAIEGETYEYTTMYADFAKTANAENILDARGIFTLAKLAEEVHAGIYADLLANIENFDSEKYGTIYRCPTCGNIILGGVRPIACPKCADGGAGLIEYTITN